MTKVKITCGGYGRTVPGTKIVRTAYLGEVVAVEDAEAARLERIGAARILTRTKPKAVATPETASAAAGACNDTPETGPAAKTAVDAPMGRETGGEAGREDGPDEATAEEDAVDIPDGVRIVDGHMTVDSLMGMTKADLLSLALDMELSVNDRMSKQKIAEAVSAVEVGYDEDAVMPDLSPEVPAV